MINHIVVVGSGVMGKGIAYVGALVGYTVTMVDINEVALKNAKQEIVIMLEKGISYAKITAEDAQRVQQNLNYEHD